MGRNDHLKRGNLLWESNRMFLPEHKEQLLERRRKQQEFTAPEPDEDRLSELNLIITEALRSGRSVIITHAGLYGPERFCGLIRRVDGQNRLVRIEGINETLVLRFNKVINVDWAK